MHANMRVPTVLLLLALCPAVTVAQRVNSPSPHFGATTIPDTSVAASLGVTLDRFTPNGKIDEPGIYNGIDRTIAFNFLGYSTASRSTRWPSLIYRTTFQIGWGHDQPTQWIQNNLHLFADLPPVVSTSPRNDALDAAFNFEVVQWAPLGRHVERFLGGGFTVGTPLSEAWLQIGAASRFGAGWPEIAAMVSIGAPFLGGAFPDSTLTSGYAAVEAQVEIPVANWLGAAWLPAPFISLRQDTGFFADLSGDGIAELHGSIGLAGRSDSWRIEAWNEYFGGRLKDKGPTGGGRIYFRMPALNLLGWLP